MVDMMPDDIPHTDDKAKRKIHPGATICFMFALVPPVLIYSSVILLEFLSGSWVVFFWEKARILPPENKTRQKAPDK